ncbi:MAG TPA: hypothetical protein ENI84_02720, partial [Thiothrix sp.]|nr:hypothetical protein [Thiothrix sp.]
MKNLIGLLTAGASLFSATAFAQPRYDIRTTSPLTSSQESVNYEFAISDCSDLKSVDITTTEGFQSFLASEAKRPLTSAIQCSFSFSTSSNQLYSPSVTTHDVNGGTDTYSEQFFEEIEKPKLSLSNVSVATVAGKQYVKVTLEASDNSDLSYISLRLSGIRASDLRAAAGVVEKALDTAFARTPGSVRIFPSSDDQTVFEFSYPV